MSRKMNRRGFDRRRRFDNDESSSSSSVNDLFDRKNRRDDNDVEDKLDDVIKLLKKILNELNEIEDEIDDNGHHHDHKKCNCHNDGRHHCHNHNHDGNDCDTVLMEVSTQRNRFGQIIGVATSNGDFGCDLTVRIPPGVAEEQGEPAQRGANAAEAIACLKCKGFKVDSVTSTEGQNIAILLTRKNCND